MVGNHDLFNKGSNSINSVRLYSYISENIKVYEEPTNIKVNGINLVLIPWVEKRIDLIKSIKEKLMPLGDDMKVYSGHGMPTTIGFERMNNTFLI